MDTDATYAERVYALLCNRNAAETALLGPQQSITFYASRCNLDAHARVLVSQWTGRLLQRWSDPAAVQVLSYHAPNGVAIPDAIDPATGSLRPIDDGAAATRRPADVRFAQVRLSIDYSDLHYDPDAACEVHLDYFIPLPMGNVTFNNAAGVATNRFTCNIEGDPFALTKAEFRDHILVPNGVNGPCGLLPAPSLGGSECSIEEDLKLRNLQSCIIIAGKESIFRSLREQTAPGFSSTAFSTVEKLTMAFTDEAGNQVALTVLEWYNAILQGAAPFLEDEL